MRLIRAFAVVLVAASLILTGATARAEDLSGVVQFLRQIPQLTDALADLAPADGQSQRSLALTLLQRYSPTGYYLIDRYENCPAKFYREKQDFLQYVQGSKPVEIAECLGTAVHETCHAYTYAMAYVLLPDGERAFGREPYSAFCLEAGANAIVRRTPVFPSAEMAAEFPQQLRTLRFSPYIWPSQANLTTQVFGVYGLLDEFTAYYHGTRTSLDLLEFYKTEAAQTRENWFSFFGGIYANYCAYPEFKLYILKYLRYAQAKYPQIYRQVLENREFTEAFRRIDRSFAGLIREFLALKPEIIGLIRGWGYEAFEDEDYLWLGQGAKREALANNRRTYELLAAELARPEYGEILSVLGL